MASSRLFYLGIFFLLSLFSVSSSLNDEEIIVISPTWNITRTQLNNFIGSLDRLEKDTWVWHWGTSKNVLRWANQTVINQTELDFYNQGSGARGGGFYVSFNTFDSRSFGPEPLGILFPKGTLQLVLGNWKALEALGLKRIPKVINDWTALGRLVPFIDTYRDTWAVIHNATLTSKVAWAWMVEEFDEPLVNAQNSYSLWKGAIELGKMNSSLIPKIDEMQRYWNLLEFLSPLRANAMRIMYGKLIWYKIDGQKFDRFHQLIIQLSQDNFPSSIDPRNDLSGQTLNPKNSSLFGISQSSILRNLNGLINDNSNPVFRGEESPVVEVEIIESEYQTLKSSPYIEIKSSFKISINETWRVFYSYPSIFNIKKLKAVSRISSALLKNITSYSLAQLKADKPLRNQLNQRMIEELLVGLFNSIQRYDIYVPEISRVFQEIYRIRPFDRDNKLIARLYEKVLFFAMGQGRGEELTHIYPDSVDYMPFYPYYRSKMSASFSLFFLKRSGLAQISRTLFIPNYKIDYFHGWNSAMETDYLTLSKSQIELDSDSFEWIINGKSTQLFDKYIPNWRAAVSYRTNIPINPWWWVSREQIDILLSKLESLKGDQWMFGAFPNTNTLLEVDRRGYAMPQDAQMGISLFTRSQFFNLSGFGGTIPFAALMRDVKYLDYFNTKPIEEVFMYKMRWQDLQQDLITISSLVPFLTSNGPLGFITYSNKLLSKTMVSYRLDDFPIPPNLTVSTEYSDNKGIWPSFMEMNQLYGNEESRQVLRHLALLDFVGPIQANRLRIQYGKELWNNIDLTKFDRFFNSLYNLTWTSMKNQSVLSTIGRRGTFDQSANFAENQIDIFSIIWSQFSGKSTNAMFRSDESWNRGKGYNSTTVVVDEELNDMQQSPYLEVKIVEKMSNGMSRVSYQHPNVFNITKFYFLLSNELVANISSYSIDELLNNRLLTKDLNRRITRELFLNSITTIRGTTMQHPITSEFFRDFERIQPFSADNFLLRRLYQRIVSNVLLVDTCVEWIPEMTLLRTLHGYYDNKIDESNLFYQNLLQSIISPQFDSIVRKLFKNESIDVDYLKGWEAFNIVNVKPLAKVIFDEEGMRWMESGDFSFLLDRDFPQWRSFI